MTGRFGYPRASGQARRRRHPLRTSLVALIVLLLLVLAVDSVAREVAESVLAAQIKKHGFPKKPTVTIQGFPFLTQLAARDFRQVDLSSSNVPEGPVTIKSITATMTGAHLNSALSGGTVDQLTGSVFITFPEIARALAAQAGPLGSLVGSAGMSLTAAGPDEIRASVNLVVARFSATWRITRVNGNEIAARLVSGNGLPGSVVSSVSYIKVPLRSLPLHLTIQSVRVSPSGIIGDLSGRNLPFGT